MGLLKKFFGTTKKHNVSNIKQNTVIKENYIINENIDSCLVEELTNAGLKYYINELYEVVDRKIKIDIYSTNGTPVEVGVSKIGGKPDVIKDFYWPINNGRHLAFLAQINLSEIRDYDDNKLLPDSGMLYFFYDSEEMEWGYDENSIEGFKVIYFDGDNNELQRMDYPADLKEQEYSIFKEVDLSFSSKWSFPSYEVVDIEFDEVASDAYFDYQSLENDNMSHLLGYFDNIQGDVRFECVDAVERINGDRRNWNELSNQEQQELLSKQNEWILLFQLDSIDEANMMWGDTGMLYFMIKKDDLKNKAFDKVWLILQCY